jgi:Tol biopolymer transport system component
MMKVRMPAACLILAVIPLLCFPGQSVNFDRDSRIVFSSDFGGNPDIYLLTRNQLTRLTDSPATDVWPVPDSKGESIVFTSNRDGNFDIYLLNLKTRELKKLTTDARNEMSPSWSADDKYVYYDLEAKNNSWQTMKLDLASGRSSALFPDPPYKSTIVAFENRRGDEIYFTGKVFLGWQVAKFNKNTGDYVALAKRGSCRPKPSPDGRLIAYVEDDADGLGDVFVMAPDGSGKRNLTPSRSKTYDYYPCFSPDGKMVVFSSSPKEKGKTGYQLHTVDLESGEVVRILSTGGNDSFPYWFQ